MYDDFLLGNIDPLQERAQANENSQEAVPRKGMFGVKGTLRDVLGLVGDAMLIQGGRDPIYRPQRQREQTADAMAGFTRDPEGAAERVTQFDPALGRELFSDYSQQELRSAQQQSLEDSRDVQNSTRRQSMLETMTNRGARLLQNAKTPEQRLYALGVIDKRLRQEGYTLDDIGLGLGMTDEEYKVFVGSDMTVNQTQSIDRRDRGLDINQQNANANTLRASRPPQGRAPRAENQDERFIRIGNKPPNQRTAGEREWYENQRKGSSSGPSRPAGVSRPSRPGTSRPRVVGTRSAD